MDPYMFDNPPSFSDNEEDDITTNRNDDDDDDDSYESFARKREMTEYIRTVISLETIFKTYRGQPTYLAPPKNSSSTKSHVPWIISMRIITPVIHPISKETMAITTSNCNLSSELFVNKKNGGSSLLRENKEVSSVQIDTLSLLANLPSHMSTVSGTHITSTIKQTFERGITGGSIQKNIVPRLLIVCTNVLDELYELEATFEDLLRLKTCMGMSHLSWETYLKQIHYALHIYCNDQLENVDEEDCHRSVSIAYEDDSKDLMKLTLVSPLRSSNTDGGSSDSMIKLKYEFELCAIRCETQYSEKMVSFVYDQTQFSSELCKKRLHDQKRIQDMSREIMELKQKLLLTEDRLALFSNHPCNHHHAMTSLNSNHQIHLEEGNKENSSESNDAANKQAKRKPPKNLLNPAMKKRKAQAGGIKIK